MSGAELAAQPQPSAALAGRIGLGGELSVYRLGFGAMRLPGIWGEPAAATDAHRLLRRAIELGVNFIDTAHAYGSASSGSARPCTPTRKISSWPRRAG